MTSSALDRDAVTVRSVHGDLVGGNESRGDQCTVIWPEETSHCEISAR